MQWYCQFRGIVVTNVSQYHRGHVMLMTGLPGKMCNFFKLLKVERGKGELELPLVHASPSFALSTDLGAKQKWQMLRVVYEKFVKLWVWNPTCGGILLSLVSGNGKAEKVTDWVECGKEEWTWKHAARRRYTYGFLLHISARSKFNPCWKDCTLFQIFISLILRQTATRIKHTAINIVPWTNVLGHFDGDILIVSMPVCTASPQAAHTKTDTLPIHNCLQPF